MIEHAVRTPDGRILACSESGSSSGAPVFYFHGIPGTRHDFEFASNRAALEGLDVRVIGIDRPGFGGSDSQKGRRYADWPSDVATVADSLGIERFAVVGYSAGGPYAAACAQALGPRITCAGIVSGVGPAETPDFRTGMGATDAIMTRLARRAPAIARLALRLATRQSTRKPEKFSATFDRELSQPDLEVHGAEAMRADVRSIFQESTRQGPAGVVDDYRVWATPSDIAYEQIAVPVRIWHGDADAIVPLHHAEHVARLIPGAEFTRLAGVGHLHTPQRWATFLASAIGNRAS